MSISDSGIQLTLSLFVGFAFFYIVYVVLSEYNKAVNDFKEQQVAGGDSGLAELYVRMSPEMFFFLRVVVAGMGFMIGLGIGSMIFAIILAVVGFIVPGSVLKNLRLKRVKKIEQQLVEGLELLGNGLKSGLTLQQAIELLVKEFPPPISQEFALVLAENRLGIEFNDALKNMADRLNSTIIQILASGVAITKRCGGDLTVIFQNIAQTIRDQATIEGKLDAVTAQGRFQGLILGIMPFALIVILWFVDHTHVETLFGYTLGIWAVVLVCVMVFLAQLWMRKLLDIDV